jgi:hypothetical protein
MVDRPYKPNLFKHLLSAAAVVGAILLGFVLGLWVGDHRRTETPATEPSAGVDSMISNIVAAVDTNEVVATPDTLPKMPEISESTRKERAAGVEYLTKHNRWNRDEMEKIPVLQGLWDAVNHYDLETIRKYAEIIECPPLTTIIEGLEQSHKTGYYASKNDRNITLSTYIRRLRQQNQ